MRGLIPSLLLLLALPLVLKGSQPLQAGFQSSDRCMACHDGLHTSKGQDISIGVDWRASVMANSSRDPYWQASVRRESIDHPPASAEVQDECSICHMPIVRYEARLKGEKGQVFSFLPQARNGTKESRDGVSCSVCHQISAENLGSKQSFTGQFVVAAPKTKDDKPEYGPFEVDAGHQRIMQSSTGGFVPTQAAHIRDSALCGTCHTLYTTARDANGKPTGTLPEQMPFLEWQHSDYNGTEKTCQSCHMPEVPEPVGITAVLPVMRAGLHQHVFVGGNFLLQRMLNQYRTELGTSALPEELTAAADGSIAFLQSQSARIAIRGADVSGGTLHMDVQVENLTGHKLPTAYPSRRAWLYVSVNDRNGQSVFESGALKADGSIVGNDNDADPARFEPHYRAITRPDEVEIFEDILGDPQEHVTTGLLQGTHYLKDNRLLPTGFDKKTASHDIAVIGDAAEDPNFTAGSDLVRYSIALGNAQGPFHVTVELWYQPIGFRWAHNLEPYKAEEPQRLVRMYDAMSQTTAVKLAAAEVTR